MLEIELAVDGLYELDFAQAIEMGRGRALDGARGRSLAAGRGRGGRPVPRRDDGRQDRARDERTCRRRDSSSTGCRTRRSHRISSRSTTSRGPRRTSSATRTRSRTPIEGSRSHGRSARAGCWSPLTLAKNFPFEMQGRLREAIELCEVALETARLSASPHELYRALFELGWTRYYAGDLSAAIAAHEESAAVDPRLAGGTIPNGGGGPGWGLGVAWLEAGEVDRARQLLLELGGEDVARTMPVERCFDWESLALARARRRKRRRRRRATHVERRKTRRSSRCSFRPPSQGGRGRPCSSRVTSRRRRLVSRTRRARPPARSEHDCRRRSRGPWRDGPSQRRASELDAVAALRDAEHELDACGSVRVRDEMRRELRRLGARCRATRAGCPGRQRCRLAEQARARDRAASSPIA